MNPNSLSQVKYSIVISLCPVLVKRYLQYITFYIYHQVPVANESQQVVQQQYQQQVMVPVSQSLQTVQGVQGPMPGQGMPIYYSVITPTQQNSTR